MIKAITFDLDGVYFVNGKSNFIQNVHRLGVSEEEAVRVFLKSDEMNSQYKTGMITDEQFWQWALEQWNLELTVEEIISLLIRGYETDEDVVQTVKNVRESGYKTLVCTNNFPARINGLQERFGFLDNFDAAVFSYEVGATKPSEKIFGELVQKSRVAGNEIVFADDNNENLAGAQLLGIKTFFFTSFESFLDDLQSVGVTV